ncbi:MAG TPA: hypothetical protein VEJ87_10950, partial [Acidimicrobiales bacterium]|nr:hypothetical protein [Acidimicrobiales bacterium]
LAAGAAEMATHAERALAGDPAVPTGSFLEREAPFGAMDDDLLRDRLFTEALRLNDLIEKLDKNPTSVMFSSRSMSAAEMRMHGRSEAALHRWDLVGDDDISSELLAQPELTLHAVTVLNSMVSGSPESPVARLEAAAGPFETAPLVFGSPDQPDVVLVADGPETHFEISEPSPCPAVTADAATRLLALWGRRSLKNTLTWNVHDATANWMSAFLWCGR